MLKMLVAVVLLASQFCARAENLNDQQRNKGDAAFKAGEFSRAYGYWAVGAWMGDGAQQERLAKLLLGPHQRALKRSQRHPSEGLRYLYRAAVGGRPTAMLTLSNALSNGSLGVLRRPDAADCWAQAAYGKQAIKSCVATTEFRDKRSRPSCSELVRIDGEAKWTATDGARLAETCVANKTPALLVPGAPPSAEDLQRVREYDKHGIEWIITGDVLQEDFERFRDAFNSTMIAAIEAREGRGYLERLEHQIDENIKQPLP